MEPSKRGRSILWGTAETGKWARRHQAGPGLGDFSTPLEASTEVEHPINFSKTAGGTNPGKETFETHTPVQQHGRFLRFESGAKPI